MGSNCSFPRLRDALRPPTDDDDDRRPTTTTDDPGGPDADAIAAAPPGSGAAAGIVCSLSLDNYSDTEFLKLTASDALADMNVTARLGTEKGPYFFTVDGPEDRNTVVWGCCPSRYSHALRPYSGVTEGYQFLTIRGPVEKREERGESGKGVEPSGMRGERGASQKGKSS